MSDPTYLEMIEDVCAWGRAGYPEVACGRYQDAAERIKRLEGELTVVKAREPEAWFFECWTRGKHAQFASVDIDDHSWIDDGLETDFTMDPDGMRNQQKHFRDCADAIEELRAELAERGSPSIDLSPLSFHEKILKQLDGREELSAAAAAVIRDLRAELHNAKATIAFLTQHVGKTEWDELVAERDHLRAELAAVKAQIEIIRDKLVSTELLEALAAVEHNRWAGWMRYQETASAERRADWPRKAGLAYSQLTHDEQESDREEVRTTLAIIEDSLNAALCAARAQAGGK